MSLCFAKTSLWLIPGEGFLSLSQYSLIISSCPSASRGWNVLSYLFSHTKPLGGQEGKKKRHSAKFLERRENMEAKSVGRIGTFTILASCPLKCRNLTTGDLSKGQGCGWMIWPCDMGAERREERWINGFPFCPRWNQLTFLSTCWERVCLD